MSQRYLSHQGSIVLTFVVEAARDAGMATENKKLREKVSSLEKQIQGSLRYFHLCLHACVCIYIHMYMHVVECNTLYISTYIRMYVRRVNNI